MREFIIYQEDLFESFMDIPPFNYREKMLFYGQYEDKLLQLDEPYYLRIRLDYLEALFFLGQYGRFLREVEGDLQYVIDHNILHFEGRDVFRRLLIFKGAALYNTEDYAEASDIFVQLCRMYPGEIKLKWYLFRSVFQRQHKHIKWIFLAYGFILSGVVLLSVTEILIGMKWPDLLLLVQESRNMLILGGALFSLATIGSSMALASYRAWKMLRQKPRLR